MKYLFSFILLFPLFCLSQNSLEKQLDSIITSEDATAFLKANTPEEGKLYTFNKERDKTKLADELFKLSKGEKKVFKSDFKKTFYKVIDKAEINHCKFSVIILDGNKTSNQSAKIIRNKVFEQYNEGYKFVDLAKLHSSGPTANIGGDTGWIKLGEVSETFDEEAFNKNRKINEAFIVDDLKHKKYYIVMKTQDKKTIEVITVLKFTEDI
ncbi:hypothetical protein FBALC1_07683 [Flavobacteriales bacterium ALC-1]|nr:hypothetical protein FBALC1_07683 [Flavobacteriales bacterium ALC-1]